MLTSGFKSDKIEDHGINEDDIEDILTVHFNGNYGDKNTYAIEGIKDLSTDSEIIELITKIILECKTDGNLENDKKIFFDLGVVIKNDGFTICMGSDQTAAIFKIYEDLFDILITKSRDLFFKYYDEFLKGE